MKTCDVVVIGAGMAGMSVAALLADRLKVAVVETESQPGYHATGRSAATFIGSYGNPVVRKFTLASESDLRKPDPEFWPNPLMKDRGLIWIAMPGQEEALANHLSSTGAGERIPVEKACEIIPILNAATISEATFEADPADLDVNEILMGYVRLFRKNGGELHCDSPVSRLARDGGSWTIESGQETFSAPVVVNAAGAWADEVAALAGLKKVGLTPLRRSVAILPPPDGVDPSEWPILGEIGENFYFKPDAGRILISPADETAVEPHDAFADDMALAAGIDAFEKATTMKVTRVEHTWGGLRTFSPDRAQVIGFDPGTEGFFWLAGQGGYGIQSAPAAARFATGLIVDGRMPESLKPFGIDPAEVAPDRYLKA